MTGDDGRPHVYRIPCCAEDGLSAAEVRELFIEQARQNLRGGYRLRVTRRDEYGTAAVVIEEACP